MFLMLDIRSTGLSGDAFARRLLEEEDVSVLPGEGFGPSAAGHVRDLRDDRRGAPARGLPADRALRRSAACRTARTRAFALTRHPIRFTS